MKSSEQGMWHHHIGPDRFGRDKQDFFMFLTEILDDKLEQQRRYKVNVDNPLMFNEILRRLEKELIKLNPRFEDFVKEFFDSRKKVIKF